MHVGMTAQGLECKSA